MEAVGKRQNCHRSTLTGTLGPVQKNFRKEYTAKTNLRGTTAEIGKKQQRQLAINHRVLLFEKQPTEDPH